jgi:hypothetical protein
MKLINATNGKERSIRATRIHLAKKEGVFVAFQSFVFEQLSSDFLFDEVQWAITA